MPSSASFHLFKGLLLKVFHDLHEEVISIAARGHSLMIQVQQLEAEAISIKCHPLVCTIPNHKNYKLHKIKTMVSPKYFMTLTFMATLVFSAIDSSRAARRLLQTAPPNMPGLPSLPKLMGMPPLPPLPMGPGMPSIPNLPQPTFPTIQPSLPKLPPLPSLPVNIPATGVVFPPLPTLPSIPTTFPSIPFLTPPPATTSSP
ncbi:hypothetical protein Csa_011847 [Cucumis sativus]|nr:hypothetical protein Csa_011847 [Cucumis sativus]